MLLFECTNLIGTYFYFVLWLQIIISDHKFNALIQSLLYFLLTSVLLKPRHKLPKECGSCVFPPSCTSILQPLDHGIIRSFEHFYRKQLVRKIISVIDFKLLHDVTLMKVNVLDAQHFTVESWCCDKHIAMCMCDDRV
jgi:hypothetical protein